MILTMNDVQVGEYLYEGKNNIKLISIPLANLKNDMMNLHFALPDAKSPDELGLGQDNRKLGISIKSIEFK